MRISHAAFATAIVFAVTVARADPPSSSDELQTAYTLKSQGRVAEAAQAFERARAAGAAPQRIALELGYLAAGWGDTVNARRLFTEAAHGADPDLARSAQAELDALAPIAAPAPVAAPTPAPAPAAPAPAPNPGSAALDEAYRVKATGDTAAAMTAFERAKAAGANPQLVAMELGYLAASTGNAETARAWFSEAERGADTTIGERAHREQAGLPKHLFADAYVDVFGWNRAVGQSNGNAVVPTVRVRAFYRPVLSVPVDLFVSAQVTRDSASRGFVGSALPRVYSDNYAIFGGGVRAKLWRRFELFGQIGPALNLLDDGRDRTALDIRAGALVFAETKDCAPPPEHGVRARFLPCAEAYAEVVYVSRFRDDVAAFARPRIGFGYLLTGPVLWQAVAEGRAAKDTNNDYWNNFADGGVGQRWRLLAPFRIDLLVSGNAGGYFGLAGRDPAPSQLTYGDLRALATTYAEF